MFERDGRRWRSLGRWSDQIAAALLTATAAGILGATGLLTSAQVLPASLSQLAFLALIGARRRQPMMVGLVGGVLLALPTIMGDASRINNSAVALPGLVAVFLVAYSLGANCRWAPSLVGLASLIAGVNTTSSSGFNPLFEMVTVAPWFEGLVVSSRRRLATELEDRARELEEERDIFAVASVRYERARIARELHDIVAHCISLMVVQAGAGERLVRSDPDGATKAFASIADAASEADVEIDRLVEFLDASAPSGPRTGLRIVDGLVRRARASGLTVSCNFIGECEDLAEASADAAYRLVQEAVTNAMKHAPGAPIDIIVEGQVGTVSVNVVNGPARGAPSVLAGAGGGHGLAGMRERAARCGGTFDAGPTAQGGWHVTADLPRRRLVGTVPAQAGGRRSLVRSRET
ncbi:MAG TPA: histidine kinase [Acidimicrobiales bacterium]|nr:histidine kinase [Acidimicrobiales bacterium]